MSYQLDTRWDLEVYNRQGQLILVVQLKSKLNASVEWAVQFRRNILAHGIFPTAPYFLMVFPDRFYLWIDSDGVNDQSEPNYIIDARPIVGPYLERAGIPAARNISVESLEIIFGTWLSKIIYSENLPNQTDESLKWLIDSGLYAAIAGGSFIGGGCDRQDKIDLKTNLDAPSMQTSILAAIATAKAEHRFVSDRELQAEEERLKQNLARIEAASLLFNQAQSLIDAAAKEEIADTSTAKPFWERLAEIGAQVPDSEWAKIPRDLASNFEHYMYGAPKEE